MEDLNEVASGLMDTETTVTTPEPTVTPEVQKPEESVKQPDNQTAVKTQEPQRLSRSARAEQMAKETKAWADRKNTEYVNQIKALEDKMKAYAPYEQYLPELQKVLEAKRQQELQQQYQQNPLQTQQQLMEQMLNERLQPFQQLIVQQQNEQAVNQSIDWMRNTYGEEVFKEASPYMANIINNTKQQFGDEAADMLARSPEHLFHTAFGYLAVQKIKEFNQNKQAGTQNKVNLAQQSAGVARPNRINRAVGAPQSKNDIEKQAFDFLSQNS